MDTKQYGRKFALTLVEGQKALDLSDMHVVFKTVQDDQEQPNNVTIRVYNLSEATVRSVQKEYSRVVLQAGYASSFGVIFDGTIKQTRIGKDSSTDSYLDILAADGDLAYNFSLVNKTLAAGSTLSDRIKAAVEAMGPAGVQLGYMPDSVISFGGTLPRGKVLWGSPRVALRAATQTAGSTWSIQNGKVNVIPLVGYLPSEAVVLTRDTGLIGFPEQTADGVNARCLINPKITPGTLVKIDNASINKTLNQNPSTQNASPAFNQRAGVQILANVTHDGLYRVFVCEHDGDTRGQNWYSDLVLLAVNLTTNQVKAYG